MEGTPLRSLPRRPAGPVDPAQALEHVAERLPALGSRAQRALALVELAGTAREDAAKELGIEPAALSAALAAGRKALRRTLVALPADGWCERAERLISDRLDGDLTSSGAARLDAHLRACDRCVTHERTLAQAQALLVESFMEAHPGPAQALTAAAGPPELRVIEPAPEPTPASRRLSPAAALLLLAGLLAVAAVLLAVLGATGVIHDVP
jgi:hypothetical protein